MFNVNLSLIYVFPFILHAASWYCKTSVFDTDLTRLAVVNNVLSVIQIKFNFYREGSWLKIDTLSLKKVVQVLSEMLFFVIFNTWHNLYAKNVGSKDSIFSVWSNWQCYQCDVHLSLFFKFRFWSFWVTDGFFKAIKKLLSDIEELVHWTKWCY